ncbi:MAG: hypothetical protein CFH01_01316 [Alphaproteobacteria bacterium MarineAlpha2_Bin1]|nr:MAG: hypothetical protein CFH01_01316 [Alphaproteobacteria bacterium MarineAlpha2_Bin1]
MSESQTEQNDQEPTMEEILSSIRRIISDDDKDSSDKSAKPSSGKEKSNNDNDEDKYYDQNDVVDLTEMVLDDGSKVKLNKDGSPQNLKNQSDTTDINDPNVKSKLDALNLIASKKTMGTDVASLLDSVTADNASAAFAQLANTRAERATTLEELVKELLRPMLKTWLDENLSQVVERLVEKEITKLSGNIKE